MLTGEHKAVWLRLFGCIEKGNFNSSLEMLGSQCNPLGQGESLEGTQTNGIVSSTRTTLLSVNDKRCIINLYLVPSADVCNTSCKVHLKIKVQNLILQSMSFFSSDMAAALCKRPTPSSDQEPGS